jgi:hypothetical protein
MKTWKFYPCHKPIEPSTMKTQTLINLVLSFACIVNLGVLLGFTNYSEERDDSIEHSALFGEPVTLGEDYIILQIHPNDCMVLDRLGLLEPCDDEEIIRFMNSVKDPQWRELPRIMIPVDGHFGSNWASYWPHYDEWELLQSIWKPTDRMSVCIKKPRL